MAGLAAWSHYRVGKNSLPLLLINRETNQFNYVSSKLTAMFLRHCTAQALSYVSGELGVGLGEHRKRALLESYRRLPAYPDARPALEMLSAAGYRLVALTNGTERSVAALLQHASLAGYFEMILSADTVRSFKPDPAVYGLLQRAGLPRERVWLVSGNPFDVIGAKACGLRAAWVQRDPSRTFDPWELGPDAVIWSLTELRQALAEPRA